MTCRFCKTVHQNNGSFVHHLRFNHKPEYAAMLAIARRLTVDGEEDLHMFNSRLAEQITEDRKELDVLMKRLETIKNRLDDNQRVMASVREMLASFDARAKSDVQDIAAAELARS